VVMFFLVFKISKIIMRSYMRNALDRYFLYFGLITSKISVFSKYLQWLDH
jgi:hypothetical protein